MKKQTTVYIVIAFALVGAAIGLTIHFTSKKEGGVPAPAPAQQQVSIPSPEANKQVSETTPTQPQQPAQTQPEQTPTPTPAPQPATTTVPTPVPASAIGIVGTPVPESAWRCVAGWNGPIKVENGRISCVGTHSCTLQANSAMCMELANKLNHGGSTLAELTQAQMIRKCDINDAQPSPCGYVIGADGNISPPAPLKPSEWQCLSGFDGPVKYENGYVYCTGAQGCTPKLSAKECGTTAEKMRKDPVYMKIIEDSGLIRKCPDGSTTEPCIWSESRFTSGANSASSIIQFPNLYDKAIVWLNPSNTSTNVMKRTYIISRRQHETTRQEMTEVHTVDGKVESNTTLVGTGNITEESPYLLRIRDDKGNTGVIEIHGNRIYVDLFGKGRVVASLAVGSA